VGKKAHQMRINKKIKAIMLIKINHKLMMKMKISPMLRAMIKIKIKIVVEMIWKKKNHLGKNASINCVILRKFIKNFDRRFNMQNIDFCVVHATKTISITIFANFASKYIRALVMPMMTINGLDVINAIDG